MPTYTLELTSAELTIIARALALADAPALLVAKIVTAPQDDAA